MKYTENFGKKATDKVTGFTGIIIGFTEYAFGCKQYLVAPPVDKDGKRLDGEWFDTGRIEIVGDGINEGSIKDENPGCDICAPIH